MSVITVSTFIYSCSGDTGSDRQKKSGRVDPMTTIDVEAGPSAADASLALAGESVESMKLKVSCSNIAEEVFEGTQFDLPIGATNCVAKLVSITIGTKVYGEPASGSGFTDFSKNDTGVFEYQADSNDKLYLKVKSQLPSPLTDDASVRYIYSAVTKFDTIVAKVSKREPTDITSLALGIAAPQVKLERAHLHSRDELHVFVNCPAKGFEGTTLGDLKCDGIDVAKIKFAAAIQDEGQLDEKRLVEISQKAKAVGEFELPAKIDGKSIRLRFGKIDTEKTYAIVASITDGDKSSYSYGFVKMGGSTTKTPDQCVAQGTQANFIQVGTELGWRDTSNCWVWMRPVTDPVLSKNRFDKCPKVKNGAVDAQLTLPYFREMKAARDRKIADLAQGAAPGLGKDLVDGTFWLAGGRVFNMKDGTVRGVKDIKADEKHSVLCVNKKD